MTIQKTKGMIGHNKQVFISGYCSIAYADL